ncbi:MAG: tetratricopeptide repeat-containing sulfotransferase family protein [Gammaproteobacteria bacterium]
MNSATVANGNGGRARAATNLSPDLRQKMQRTVTLQRTGRIEEALAAYREITAQAPDFADAFHYGALAAHATGDNGLARQWLATAERLAPERLEFLLNSVLVFDEIGEMDEAETRAAHARRLAPADPRPLICHANVLLKQNRGDNLIDELDALTRACPRVPRVWLLLARSCLQGGRRADARAAFVSACRVAENFAAAWLEYAQFLREENELQAAREHYQRVVEIGDAYERANAERGLASIAAQTGDKDQARQYAERALASSADMHYAWTILVDASDETELAALRPRMEKAREDTQSPEACALDFALGNVYERLGDYPTAWNAWTRGNRSWRREIGYDSARESRFLADIRRYMDHDFFARHSRSGDPSRLPVFIVGLPRSGSTLLERALGGHPAIAEGGEMHTIPDILRRRAGPEDRHRMASWFAQRSNLEIGAIATECLAFLSTKANGAERLTDKLLSNFALIGLIRACFPNAAVIHMQRDPRDVFVSCWSKLFDTSLGYCYDPTEFRAHYSDYRTMMNHWATTIGREGIIEVEYEELVADFEKTVTRVLEAIGLGWHPDCAQFSARPGNVRTASWFQVRRPLYSSSVGRWKRYREQLGSLADLEAWK